ncbi:non-specific serine/threonine protein kinase [Ranunculus cassubicifolius]
MVSSQLSGLAKSNMCRPPDAIPPEGVEFDFFDVFGPLPIQKVDIETVEESTDVLYDDPVVIYSRSHSLVGPTSCVSQSLKFSKLTLHETEESLEIWEDLNKDTLEETELPKDVDEEHDQPAETFAVGLDDFEVLKVVGQGAFGKVFQVRKKGTFDIYAMKVVRKDKILEKNHVEYIKAERDILTKVDHPFIVQLKYSFQTKYRLYLVLDFVNGGHLFFQLYRHGLFREDLAHIYAAEIVSAVSHLHANGIMHRDLKPENILLDADGHLLTDSGIDLFCFGATKQVVFCELNFLYIEFHSFMWHNKSSKGTAVNRSYSQMKKPHRKSLSPLNWFPRKKVDSYLKRKIRLLQVGK